jgi:capsular exopolysaccharide synthesis family protein
MKSLQGEVCLAPVRSAQYLRDSQRQFFDLPFDRRVSISAYARIVWNRRWVAIPVAMSVFLIVLFATVKQKPVFRATGSLEVDMPKAAVAGVTSLFQDQAASDNYLQIQTEILHSRAMVTELVKKIAPVEVTDAPHGDFGPASIDTVVHGLSVEVLRGSRLIQIGDESTSPDTAAHVVNMLMALYIEKVGERRIESAQNASSWLLNQLNETRTKLEQATALLQRYEQDHQILFVSSRDGIPQSLENERLEQLQADLRRVQEIRIEKEAMNKRAQAGDTLVLSDPLLESLQTQETSLEQHLSELSVKLGPNFPQVKVAQAQLSDVRATEQIERAKIVQMRGFEFEAAVRQENLTRAALDRQQKVISGASQQLLQDGILKRDVELDKQLYEGLLRQMNEAGISSKLDASSAHVVESAQIPTTSIRPRVAYNLILGAFAGLTLAIGFVFFQEHIQDTFQTEDDVELHLNLPLLAMVPAAPIRCLTNAEWSFAAKNAISISDSADRSAIAGPENWFRLDRDGNNYFELSESIRNLRTSLLFAQNGVFPHSILISSAVPSEGKTTISANLSVALAQLGKRVLSIDGDLRRPSVHRIFSMSNSTGLSEYLQGHGDWHSVIRPSGVKGLHVIVSGSRPANPAELLSSHRMEELLRHARTQYDVVVIDSPTLLHMADSRLLASYAEAVVLVVKSGDTPKKLVKEAFANLRSVSARVVGVVLNCVDLRNEEYSSSYSNYSDAGRDVHEQNAR